MSKIAVMGSRETVIGFKALGLEVFPVSNSTDAKVVFHKLAVPGTDYAIIYVEETVVQYLSAELEQCSKQTMPAVIMIPGREGTLGLGHSALQAAIKRAIG